MNAVQNIPKLAAVIQLATVRWEVAVVAGSDSADRFDLVEFRSWLCSVGHFYLGISFRCCRKFIDPNLLVVHFVFHNDRIAKSAHGPHVQ